MKYTLTNIAEPLLQFLTAEKIVCHTPGSLIEIIKIVEQTVAKFIDPDWGDKVNSDIGLLYCTGLPG
jgi:hypothetical protein